MKSSFPQIGFDRFIQMDWALLALDVRSGKRTLEDLDDVLASSHAGLAARKKTRTVINRLWLEPRADLAKFAERGIKIYSNAPDSNAPILTWGMAIATYPFFGMVAEIIGRLTTLQGECTSAEIHRRMSEIYGEREGTRRMTNMVLQSQASWGLLRRSENTRLIARGNPIELKEDDINCWLIEACMIYSKKSLNLQSAKSHPVLFPFSFSKNLHYIISKCNFLELRIESSGNEIVDLKNAS